MGTTYRVKTEVFEGPLELLLSLIEKRKLLINDIALAAVADDYMAHIRKLGRFPVREAAQFLLVAATLVLIKSKSLLPSLALTPEEEGSIEDLEKRLKLYQRLRGLGTRHIKSMYGHRRIFARLPQKSRDPVFSPDKKCTPEGLRAAIRHVAEALPMPEKIPETAIKKIISLEEMIERLTTRITSSLKLSFREFSGNDKEKTHVIVSFLAMLELVKKGAIEATQDRQFADINMESRDISVPSYR